MNQKTLMLLLKEAADAKCSKARLCKIHYELSLSAPQIDEAAEGMKIVLNALYVDTLAHDRKLLPSLFPVFAIICGDREKNMLHPDVNWEIMED